MLHEGALLKAPERKGQTFKAELKFILRRPVFDSVLPSTPFFPDGPERERESESRAYFSVLFCRLLSPLNAAVRPHRRRASPHLRYHH